MQNIIARTAIVAAFAALASSSAVAAPTAELKVTGVIKPIACTPTIGGGGTVQYDNIPIASLNKGAPTKLEPKEVPFTFSCEAAAKIALKFADNKAATKVSGLAPLIASNGHEASMMGLGAGNGKNIGAYFVALKQGSFTADGAAVDTLFTTNQGAAWTKGSHGAFYTNNWLTWASAGTTTPLAVKTVSGMLSVTAVIDKTDNLDLTSEVKLDGSGTIEVIYL